MAYCEYPGRTHTNSRVAVGRCLPLGPDFVAAYGAREPSLVLGMRICNFCRWGIQRRHPQVQPAQIPPVQPAQILPVQPAQVPPAQIPPTVSPRGRGRPLSSPISNPPESSPSPRGRGRGRPPRSSPTNQPPLQVVQSSRPVPVPVYNFRQSTTTDTPSYVPQPSSSVGASSTVARATSEYTADINDLKRDDINKILELLHLHPLLSTETSDVKKTYGDATDRFRTLLEDISHHPVYLEPSKSDNVRIRRTMDPDNECKDCRDLLTGLEDAFAATGDKSEMYKILTCVPLHCTRDYIREKFKCTKHMAEKSMKLRREIGAFSCPPKVVGRKMPDDTILQVRLFYYDDEISWLNNAAKRTILDYPDAKTWSGPKTRVPQRLMKMTLVDVYNEFVGIKLDAEDVNFMIPSLSFFAKLKPRCCKWAKSRGFHNTCFCEIHGNFEFMVIAANLEVDFKGLLEHVLCPEPTEKCWLAVCDNCPIDANFYALFGVNIDEEMDADLEEAGGAVVEELVEEAAVAEVQVEGNQAAGGLAGQSIGYPNEANDDDDDEHPIKVMYWGLESGKPGLDLLEKYLTKYELREEIRDYVPKISQHHFLVKRQIEYLDRLIETILKTGNFASLLVDFAMNLEFVKQHSPTGNTWNNGQCTILPFVLHYYKNGVKIQKVIVVVSDYLVHDSESFYVFRKFALDYILKDIHKFDKIFYQSDGARQQFKNRFNLANLMCHEEDFPGVAAEWVFTPTNHGKGLSDAFAAVVKRFARLRSLELQRAEQGKIIRNAKEVYEICQKLEDKQKIKMLHVTTAQVKDFLAEVNLEARYAKMTNFSGHSVMHHFSPVDKYDMDWKIYSDGPVAKTVRIFKKDPGDELMYPSNINEAEAGQFVAVKIEDSLVIGEIQLVDYDEYIVEIRTLKKGARNKYLWPKYDNNIVLSFGEILVILSPPVVNDDLSFKFNEDEHKGLVEKFGKN